MNLFNSILFINIRWLDVIDILLVAYLIYALYKLIKGTAAINIFIGIVAVYLVWKLVKVLEMELLSEILGQFIGLGVLALIIVFQQEIRSFLLMLGSNNIFSKAKSYGFIRKMIKDENKKYPQLDQIMLAMDQLTQTYLGGLIVITRQNELNDISRSGTIIDAQISDALILNIFSKNSPLHDGALIIHDGRIHSARCILPLSSNMELPPERGLRHRAALGLTEATDAICIVISEETGKYSLSYDGKILFDRSKDQIKERILNLMQIQLPVES